jgi:hypothetical protein
VAFDLLHHAKHVPVLPCLNHLAIFDLNHGKAGNADLRASGRDAESEAGMSGSTGPANTGFVVLGENLFDVDMDVGEGVMHTVEIQQIGLNANGVLAPVVENDVRREQFSDCATTTPIPNHFKPKSAQFPRSL